MASTEQALSGGNERRPPGKDESSIVEIDATLGRTLGLNNGLKVGHVILSG